MPITGIRDITTGRTIPLEQYRQEQKSGEALRRGDPYPLALVEAVLDSAKPRNYFSASATKSCPRQMVLMNKIDYAIDIDNSLKALKGTWFHRVMESHTEESDVSLVEQEFTRELLVTVDGSAHVLEMRGRPDHILTDKGLVLDYKTTGYIKRDFTGYDGHKTQLSIYGWLARSVYDDIRNGVLYYIGENKTMAVVFDLYSDEKVEEIIRRESQEFIRWKRDPNYLPPIPEDPEKLLWCSRCPVSKACDWLHEEGVAHLE